MGKLWEEGAGSDWEEAGGKLLAGNNQLLDCVHFVITHPSVLL